MIQVAQNQSYASLPLNCQPSIQNQYPESAAAGEKIVIITTVTNTCITNYNRVVVNILLPNTSLILSTAPASPAKNTVTAPSTGGPWSLIVQVLWVVYPSGGTLAISQTTITIKINGPLTISAITSRTVSSTLFTSSRVVANSTLLSSAITSVEVSSSAVTPYSTVTSSENATSTSPSPTASNNPTFNTPSTLQSSSASNFLPFRLQSSTIALILVVVVILLVGIFALRRRRG
jgi:hypothetical protein